MELKVGVNLEVKDWVATVTVNRPPANALNRETYDGIRDAFYEIDSRDDIKVVIFTGAGKIFMAGNEFEEFKYFYEKASCTMYYDTIKNACCAVKNCKYPVIGAINGAAIGAGCSFAGCCDVIVAAERAKFALPEIKLGIIGADEFASLMIPEKEVRWMALTGEPITAEKIASYGGIHTVVPREEVMDEAMKIAESMMTNSRRSLMLWKRSLNENNEHHLPEKFNGNLQCTIEFQDYNDFQEACEAYIAKREPEFEEK